MAKPLTEPAETYAQRYRRENRELLMLKERARRRQKSILRIEGELELLNLQIANLSGKPSRAWDSKCALCGRIDPG